MKKIFIRQPKPEITDSHQLLREIERKDALFRTFATIFGAIVLILNTAILLIVLTNTTQTKSLVQSSNKNVESQKVVIDDLAKNSKQRTQQIGDLQTHLDCIFKYFATADRSSNTTLSLSPNQQACDVNLNPTTSASVGSTGSTKSP